MSWSLIPSRLGKLWQMSALRQAVVLSAIFLSLLLVAGVATVALLYQEIERSVAQELEGRYQVLAEQLATSAQLPEQLPRSYLMFASLRLPSGAVIGPDYPELFALDGSAKLELELDDERENWRVISRAHLRGQLVVALNTDRRYKLLERVAEIFASIGLLTLLATLACGVYVGLKHQRRVDVIHRVLDRLADGDFDGPVRIHSKNDDLDRLAIRLDETSGHLKRLLQQSRDLSANIAHDLKTPMARLRANLERALDAPEEAVRAQLLEASLDQVDQMILTFEAILRIAHLSGGAQRSRFVELSIEALVREIGEIYQAVIEDSGHRFTLQIEPCERVMGDRELIIQMIANLLENALRHTPEGCEVTLSCCASQICVSDSGPGVAEEDRERILQPMVRLEKSRHSPGNGLGLAMVNSVVQLHRASLVFEDARVSDTAPGLKVRIDFAGK
ncbi:MAG: sensor histidine kinase [Pseudomonadales bacterium]